MSNYYDLNERAILAMSDRLTNNLKTVIDQINATTAGDPNRNQTHLPYPVKILDAPPVLSQLVQLPLVAIGDGDITFTDDIGWTATANYQMVVIAYVSSPDPEVLAWQLRRYAQAIVTAAFNQTRNVDSGVYSGAWGVVLKKVIPGKRVVSKDPKNAGEILSWVAVVLELRDEQQVP